VFSTTGTVTSVLAAVLRATFFGSGAGAATAGAAGAGVGSATFLVAVFFTVFVSLVIVFALE
jgi:hypothetical protein